MLVYVDDMHRALLNLELDLAELFSQTKAWKGTMHVGMTAGSGKQHASHCIHSWSFYEVPIEGITSGTETSWLARARNLVSGS